ncbi:lytic transglycosylase domain-containing protein [Patescibacteria group bacterium]|nr:lytic transglycosylase domain-containing protein [Patescibacteria group bacterium]
MITMFASALGVMMLVSPTIMNEPDTKAYETEAVVEQSHGETEHIRPLEERIDLSKSIETTEGTATGATVVLEQKSLERVKNAEKLAYEEAKRNDTTGFDLVYRAAGEKYGIPWEVLSAVHKVETGRRGNTGIASYAGATGPMQFLPSTFRRYGVDGDGDGVASINDSDDAIYSAANYLAASGGSSSIRRGLYAYNHSDAYVNKVLGVARSIGYRG